MQIIKDHISEIKQLCDKYRVKTLFAFGSVTGNKFNTASDIDLVVDFDIKDPLEYADSYFALKFQLQQLLKRQIDLLEQKAIKNPHLRQEISKTQVLVYGN
jgi:predicted nucleotidyltransferase